MNTRIRLNKRLLLLILGALLLVSLAACGGDGPEELDILVKLEHGSLTPGTIQVKQGDMVTLKIEAEESGEFHLHGYDIEMDVEAGVPTDFFVAADATGRFRITFHAAEEEHGSEMEHGEIFDSDHLEPGATFTYVVEPGHEGKHIPFHSNLQPEINGMISVSENADLSGAVSIEIVDTEAIPQEVTVVPGTSITWVNNSSQEQEIVSGYHTEGEEDHEEEEEQEIGILEVRPR